FLLAGAIGLAGINQRGLEVSYLGRVGYEDTQSCGNLAIPGWVTNNLVCEAADDFVAGPILGRVLRIFAEQTLIAVGAGADRTLERVEGFLALFRGRNSQPIQRALRILVAHRQDEAISEEHEDAVGSWRRSPVKVGVRGQRETIGSGVCKVTIGPVA